jgi:hypothetical protein
MSHKFLREAAKFCAGLVAADFLTLMWAWSNDLFPVQTWGVSWSADVVLPAAAFDIGLFIILVHYGWHLGRIPRPKERMYLLVAGAIFSVVAVAHLVRIFTQGDFVLWGWTVPLWLSWLGTMIAAYLAYASFHFSARSR